MSNKSNLKKNMEKKSRQVFCINQHNSVLFPYKNHAYHVYKPKQKGLSKCIVNRIISDYEIMFTHYKKVLITRIDLHPHSYSASNTNIELFFKQLVKCLSEQYKCKVLYHCAREQSSSDIEHYHLEILLSGHKINHSHKLLLLIKSIWEKNFNGTISFVDNPFCIVYRGNKASLKQAIYRSSYLAKEHTKEKNGKAKGFLYNKLKPSDKFDSKTDFMLVDSNITFENNMRKLMTVKTNFKEQSNKNAEKKYAWFINQPRSQQLKECIASRTTSLAHLMPTLSEYTINHSSEEV